MDDILTAEKKRISGEWDNKKGLWIFPCESFFNVSSEQYGTISFEHMISGISKTMNSGSFDILDAVFSSVFAHST